MERMCIKLCQWNWLLAQSLKGTVLVVNLSSFHSLINMVQTHVGLVQEILRCRKFSANSEFDWFKSSIYKLPRYCSSAWEGTCLFKKSLWKVSNETAGG